MPAGGPSPAPCNSDLLPPASPLSACFPAPRSDAHGPRAPVTERPSSLPISPCMPTSEASRACCSCAGLGLPAPRSRRSPAAARSSAPWPAPAALPAAAACTGIGGAGATALALLSIRSAARLTHDSLPCPVTPATATALPPPGRANGTSTLSDTHSRRPRTTRPPFALTHDSLVRCCTQWLSGRRPRPPRPPAPLASYLSPEAQTRSVHTRSRIRLEPPAAAAPAIVNPPADVAVEKRDR